MFGGTWCTTIEQFIIPTGESFSFDCQQDESVFFARKLGEWSQIDENEYKYSHLNY